MRFELQWLSQRIRSFKTAASSPSPPISYPTPWAYWPLASDLADYSGNDRDLSGSVGTFTATGGVVDGFASGNISISRTISPSLSEFTVQYWCKLIDSTSLFSVLNNLALSASGFRPAIPPFVPAANANITFGSSVVINSSTDWVSAVITGDSANYSGYIDSVLSASNSYTYSASNFFASGFPSAPVCEMAIWDVALTASEIEAVYTQGAAGFPLVP